MANIKDVCNEYGCLLPFYMPENADETIDKRTHEHPVKTYSEDFFEKFPKSNRDVLLNPTGCVHLLYGVDVPRCCCVNISVENVTETISCHECWNQEMKK